MHCQNCVRFNPSIAELHARCSDTLIYFALLGLALFYVVSVRTYPGHVRDMTGLTMAGTWPVYEREVAAISRIWDAQYSQQVAMVLPSNVCSYGAI